MERKNHPPAVVHYQSGKRKKRPHRTEYITFRVTPAEKQAILDDALRNGHSPSDFCRLRCLRQKVADMSDEARRERRIFINMANNLNQIARHFNTEGATPRTMAELEQLMAKIHKQKLS